MAPRKKDSKQAPPKFGIIAVIREDTVDGFARSLHLTTGANTIEIRLDTCHYGSTGPFLLPEEIARAIASNCSKPMILTLRSLEQGGTYTISLKEQLVFWETLPIVLKDLINDPAVMVYVDLGIDLIKHLAEVGQQQLFPWNKVGVSHHFMKNTPSDRELQEKLTEMEQCPAKAFIKLVTYANDEGDITRLERLNNNLVDNRPKMIFALGPEGGSRIESFTQWGGAGIYAYFRGRGKALAPGMPTVEELLEDKHVRTRQMLPSF